MTVEAPRSLPACGRRARALGWWLAVAVVASVAAVGLGMPVVAALAVGARWLDVGETPPYAPADAVAALSGDTGFLRTRLAAALVLGGVAPLLVVSGAGWGGDDAYEMLKAASDAGVRGERVLVEPNARDTRENVLRIAELARRRGWRSVLLVTSQWHTRRVRLLATRLAPDVALRVTGVPDVAPLPFGVRVGEYTRLFMQAAMVW